MKKYILYLILLIVAFGCKRETQEIKEDLLPLGIQSISPQSPIDIGSTINVKFREEFESENLNQDSMQIIKGGKVVAGNLTYGKNQFSFVPDHSMSTTTSYQIQFSESLHDLAGNGLVTTIPLSRTTSTQAAGIDAVSQSATQNDDGAIQVDEGTIEGSENPTLNSWKLKLLTQPTRPISITVANPFSDAYTLSPTSFDFTRENWDQTQLIHLTSTDNDYAAGDLNGTFVITMEGEDNGYNGLIRTIKVLQFDDDTAGFIIKRSNQYTFESGINNQFTVKLSSQPLSSTVTVDLTTNGTATPSPTQLTFTESNWDQTQSVTLSGPDNGTTTGSVKYPFTLTGQASSDDYQNLTSELSFYHADDEVNFNLSGISTSISEGNSFSFSLSLNAPPVADVVLPLKVSDTSELSLSASEVTFTSDNWDTTQKVKVTALKDFTIDGTQVSILNFLPLESKDLSYHGINGTDYSISVANIEQALFNVAYSATSIKETSSATASVTLNTKPTGNVSFEILSSDSTELGINKTSMTFTTDNWNVAQIITLAAVADQTDDGNQTVTLSFHSTTSSDSNYHGLTHSKNIIVVNAIPVVVTVKTKSWAREISWEIVNSKGNIVASDQNFFDNQTFTKSVYLQGDYQLILKDSYGDGWGGATISLPSPAVPAVTSATLSSGSEITISFSVQ